MVKVLKKKKIKDKFYFSKEEYSERFKNSFNSQEFSDMKVKFEKSNKILYVHKIILCSASSHFENVLFF
jgi:hypothetical protein